MFKHLTCQLHLSMSNVQGCQWKNMCHIQFDASNDKIMATQSTNATAKRCVADVEREITLLASAEANPNASTAKGNTLHSPRNAPNTIPSCEEGDLLHRSNTNCECNPCYIFFFNSFISPDIKYVLQIYVF